MSDSAPPPQPQLDPFRFLAPLLLVGAVLLVFGQTVSFGLLGFDDTQHLQDNPWLWPPESRDLGRFWREPYWGLYIPVSYSWFGFLAWLSELTSPADGQPRLNPAIFHGANIILHGGCVLLLYGLLKRLGTTTLAAFAGAMLFALHPLQVESVAWISEGRGLLASLFSLAAVWSYATAFRLRVIADDLPPEPMQPTRTSLLFFASLLACAAALLSKPSAAAIPLVLLVLESANAKRRDAGIVAMRLGPFFLLVAAAALITKMLQPDAQLTETSPLWQRPIIALDALSFYLGKLFVPLLLGIDYGRTPQRVWSDGATWFTALIPLALLAATWRFDRRRFTFIGLLLFVASLAPMLGLVPFVFQKISTVADRYAHLAMIGPAFALAAGLTVWRVDGKLPFVIVIVVLVALGLLSRQQSRVWRNDMSLYEQALRVNPQSTVALFNTAKRYQREGNVDRAERYYKEAVRVSPNDANTLMELSNLARDRGDAKDAFDWARRMVAAAPQASDAHLTLGVALAVLRDMPGAEREFRIALELKPTFPSQLRTNLARSLAAQGRLEEAERECRRAIELDANSPEARQLLENIVTDRSRTKP